MNKQNPIDDFFRAKLSQRDFAFQEAHWKAAQRMILSDQRQRKRRLLHLFSYLLALGTVIAVPVLIGTLSLARDHVQAAHPDQEFVAQNDIQQDNIVSNAQSDALNHVDVDALAGTNSDPAPSFGLNKPNANPISANPSSNLNNHSKSDKNATLKSGPLSAFFNRNSTANNKPADQVSQNNTSLISTTQGLVESIQNRLDGITFIQNRSFKGLKTVLGQNPSTLYPVPGLMHSRHFFGLSIGTNLAQGIFGNQNQAADLSSHPVIGLKYAYALQPSIRIQTGLYYSGRGGLNSELSNGGSLFGFGQTQTSTVVQINRLHFAEIPVYLDYRIQNRHYIFTGLNLSYLINSSASVSMIETDPFGNTRTEQSRDWGYHNGFVPTDVALGLGYAYYLGRGIRIGLSGHYGLRDISLDHIYDADRTDRNIQLRFFVESDLFAR